MTPDPDRREPHHASVSIATTREAVEALRGLWSRLAVPDIDAELDYFLAVAENAPQVVSPYVIRIKRGDGPDMLVVARLENLPIRLRLGYWTFAGPVMRAVVVSFDGVLGARSREDELLAMRELRHLLDIGEADLLLMRNVGGQTSLAAAARQGVSKLRLAHGQPVERRWIAHLPGSLEAFLSSRSAKSRSSYRREDRLLHAAFAERLRMRRFELPEELDELCRDMECVSALTYQHALGAGFTNGAMERALVSLGLRKGTYRCWMLYLDDRPVSFWAGMAHGDTFYPTTPGFDPRHGEYSIGRYTMFRMVEDLCAEPDLTRIDFGRGDAQYKTEYAVVSNEVSDLWVAARRSRPILVVSALSILAFINRHGRRIAENRNWSARIKSFWRRRLVAGADERERREA